MSTRAAKFLVNEIEPRMKRAGLTFEDIKPMAHLFGAIVRAEEAGQMVRHQSRQWLDELFASLTA